jgi:hypothetical protein
VRPIQRVLPAEKPRNKAALQLKKTPNTEIRVRAAIRFCSYLARNNATLRNSVFGVRYSVFNFLF